MKATTRIEAEAPPICLLWEVKGDKEKYKALREMSYSLFMLIAYSRTIDFETRSSVLQLFYSR